MNFAGRWQAELDGATWRLGDVLSRQLPFRAAQTVRGAVGKGRSGPIGAGERVGVSRDFDCFRALSDGCAAFGGLLQHVGLAGGGVGGTVADILSRFGAEGPLLQWFQDARIDIPDGSFSLARDPMVSRRFEAVVAELTAVAAQTLQNTGIAVLGANFEAHATYYVVLAHPEAPGRVILLSCNTGYQTQHQTKEAGDRDSKWRLLAPRIGPRERLNALMAGLGHVCAPDDPAGHWYADFGARMDAAGFFEAPCGELNALIQMLPQSEQRGDSCEPHGFLWAFGTAVTSRIWQGRGEDSGDRFHSTGRADRTELDAVWRAYFAGASELYLSAPQLPVVTPTDVDGLLEPMLLQDPRYRERAARGLTANRCQGLTVLTRSEGRLVKLATFLRADDIQTWGPIFREAAAEMGEENAGSLLNERYAVGSLQSTVALTLAHDASPENAEKVAEMLLLWIRAAAQWIRQDGQLWPLRWHVERMPGDGPHLRALRDETWGDGGRSAPRGVYRTRDRSMCYKTHGDRGGV